MEKTSNNKYDFWGRLSLAVTVMSPPRQTPRQHPDNLIICMTLAMRRGDGERGGGGEGGRKPPKASRRSRASGRAPGGGAGAGPGGWRCAATRGGAVAAAARGPAERGNDVSLLFTFQRRVTAQRERRINQPPGDPPGAKNRSRAGEGKHMEPRCIIRPEWGGHGRDAGTRVGRARWRLKSRGAAARGCRAPLRCDKARLC